MVYGTVTAYQQHSPTRKHVAQSTADIPFLHHTGYIALTAFVINMLVVLLLTPIFRTLRLPDGTDETAHADYTADADDPPAKKPELVAE